MKLTEFYNCALRSPKEPIVLDLEEQQAVVQTKTARNDPDANANARDVLAKTLEREIKAGTVGLEQVLQDLRINNRNEPLTGEIVDGYRLKFRNTEGFKEVSGVPVENDPYFSHEEKYRRAQKKAIGKGTTSNKILRRNHWLKANKVRILQSDVEHTETRSYHSYGENQETKRLRSTLKSYEKSWKALCRGKRSRFTRKKEWTPLYQNGTLVENGRLRNLAVYVLARKLSAECKLLSATGQTGARGQRAQEELRQKINEDYMNLRSIINECKTDAEGSNLSLAISLHTLDVAATAFDLHAMASNEATANADGADGGGDHFLALLVNVYQATDHENAQRVIHNLGTIANPERTGRRNWFQQRHENVSLHRDLRQACENSGFFDKNFLTHFWAGHHKELLGKDTSSLTASQVKGFIDALGKEAASKGKLLNIERLHGEMIVDPLAPAPPTPPRPIASGGGEPVFPRHVGYEDAEEINLPAGHAGVHDQFNTISAGSDYLEYDHDVGNFFMTALGDHVPIRKSDINEIEVRLSKQYIADHGLVSLGNVAKNEVHGSVLGNPLLMVVCLEYLEEKHERSCEEALKINVSSQLNLVRAVGGDNHSKDAGLSTLLEGKNGINLGLEERLRDNFMEGFREAYKKSDEPLSEFRDMKVLGEKMRANLPNLEDAEFSPVDKTENQLTTYQALFCSDIPEQTFKNAKNNLHRMRGALQALGDPDMRVEDRLEALIKVEAIFNDVEKAQVKNTGFSARPSSALDYRPRSQHLALQRRTRDDLDTSQVEVDTDWLPRRFRSLNDRSVEGAVSVREEQPERMFAPDGGLFAPDGGLFEPRTKPPTSNTKMFINSSTHSDDSEEVHRDYFLSAHGNTGNIDPDSGTTSRADSFFSLAGDPEPGSAIPERVTTEPPSEPKEEPAKLQGDALKMRLMTVFSDLSQIMDDTHLFVGERRSSAVIPPSTNSELPEQDVQLQEARQTGTASPVINANRQVRFRDPAVQLEEGIGIAGVQQPDLQQDLIHSDAESTVSAESDETDIVQNNFQEEVHAIRAVVHARNRAIRMQRELAHRRKAPLDQNQLYEIRGADGQPVDTGWVNRLAGLVHIGQVVSSANNAPPQLTSAFIHPLTTERQNIEPRNLASKNNLAGEFRKSTFEKFIS